MAVNLNDSNDDNWFCSENQSLKSELPSSLSFFLIHMFILQLLSAYCVLGPGTLKNEADKPFLVKEMDEQITIIQC